jgi:uncharacterized protein GlcG (DUF336 family)
MPDFPLVLADPTRGPTASQAAGLTLGAVDAILAAAVAEARRAGVAVTVAVVDSGGILQGMRRMDGADPMSRTLAEDKAWTALMNRMPTGDLAAVVQPGQEFFGYHTLAGGRTVIFAGGMPLVRDDVLVGGVGVSGGDSAQDQRIVDAAVRAFG